MKQPLFNFTICWCLFVFLVSCISCSALDELNQQGKSIRAGRRTRRREPSKAIRGSATTTERQLVDLPQRKIPPINTKATLKLSRRTWEDFVDFSNVPSEIPSVFPSPAPSSTPSGIPSPTPSSRPSSAPSESSIPSSSPSITPSNLPSDTIEEDGPTRFYVMGDVPYSDSQAETMKDHILTLPSDAEFLIHLGDIRAARNQSDLCDLQEYQDVADILLNSTVPVFIVPGGMAKSVENTDYGIDICVCRPAKLTWKSFLPLLCRCVDNEWNDCPNPEEGEMHWQTVFDEFDQRWEHKYDTQYHPTLLGNFHFVHKQTLYIGLSLLGGRVRDTDEWDARVSAVYAYFYETVERRVRNPMTSDASSVVMMAHAVPTKENDNFFKPLEKYVSKELKDQYPFLYLHGDTHVFDYERMEKSLERLSVEGEAREPPMQLTVDQENEEGIFLYERQK